MTAVEKVLASASGAASVEPWDVVYPEPALVFLHDGHVEGARRELDALGIDRITRCGSTSSLGSGHDQF
jgi:3-isopropylmalate/(R)-2-methylmalate dehydratase large subunit